MNEGRKDDGYFHHSIHRYVMRFWISYNKEYNAVSALWCGTGMNLVAAGFNA